MQLEFSGAAREVTGSCHIVRTNGRTILLDCGLFQGRRSETNAKNRRLPLPEPLYTMRHAARTQAQMIGVPYRRWVDVCPGVRACFTEAGHILGSASVMLEAEEHGRLTRLVFSGDVGRAGLPIIRDPEPPEGAHAVILESTYGDRDHAPYESARDTLARVVRDTAARGGRVIVPAFAVGRTQELVYDLHALFDAGAIPRIPIVIDSPLAVDATGIFVAHPDVYDRGEELVTAHLFQFGLVRYVRDVEESKALNAERAPIVVISASGMAESGRILHHLLHGAPDPRNTILIVGFQAEHTLGRRIVERRAMLRVFGEEVPLRAQVEVLDGYSAHADRTELVRWLDAVKARSPGLRRVHLVHGEPPAQEALATWLAARGYAVDVPATGDVAEV